MSTTNRRGFTLIEAMLASVLLALAVVAFASAMVSATQGTDYANQRRRVESACRENMEHLAARSLASLPVPAGSGATVQLPSGLLAHPQIDDIVTTAHLTFLQRSGTQSARTIALLTVESTGSDQSTATLQRVLTAAEMTK